MKKLRFLQCAYIPSVLKTVNVNDELDLDDKIAEILLNQGIADELSPEFNGDKDENGEQNAPKTRKPRKKVAEISE